MRRFFIFVLICCLGMSMTSCRYFDVPVDVEVLGYGTVGQDTERDLYYAEMDSARYVLDKMRKSPQLRQNLCKGLIMKPLKIQQE